MKQRRSIEIAEAQFAGHGSDGTGMAVKRLPFKLKVSVEGVNLLENKIRATLFVVSGKDLSKAQEVVLANAQPLKVECLVSDDGCSATLKVVLFVLNSAYNKMDFRLKLEPLDGHSGQPIAGLFVWTDPIQVVSKVEQIARLDAVAIAGSGPGGEEGGGEDQQVATVVEKAQRIRSEYVQQLRDVRDMQQQHLDHIHSLLQAKRAEIQELGLHHLIDDESAIIPLRYEPVQKLRQKGAAKAGKRETKPRGGAQQKTKRKKRKLNDDDDSDDQVDGGEDVDDDYVYGDDEDEGGEDGHNQHHQQQQVVGKPGEKERRQIAEQMLKDLHNVDPFDVSFFRTVKGFQDLEKNLVAISNAHEKLNAKEKAALSRILDYAAFPARDGGKKIDECKCVDCPYRKLAAEHE